MKADIHPDYHEITVEMTNGEKFKTRSTYGKKGDTLKLDVDITTHPAWTGAVGFIDENASKIASFKKKFGGLDFSGSSAKVQEKKEEKKD
jgi:large subunit ribosomal protein L31